MLTKITIIFQALWLMLSQREFMDVYKRSITLRSMQKSGTNYLRLLLSNYVYNLEALKQGKLDFEEVNYDKMQNELFPNVRNDVFIKYNAYVPAGMNVRTREGLSYADFMYDHGCTLDGNLLSSLIKPAKLLMIYRNPLDVLISRFFYFYKNRKGSEDTHTHPREIIGSYIPQFAKDYGWMRQYAAKAPYSLLLSYEELKQYPEATLSKIVKFLDLELNEELIRFSVQASSISKVRDAEKKRGKAIHSPEAGIKGSFARSGSIGQWKEYFDDTDVAAVSRILEEQGIRMDEFVLENSGKPTAAN